MTSINLQRKYRRIESSRGRVGVKINFLGGGSNLRKTKKRRSQRRQRIKKQHLANRKQTNI